ncbi:uncharacterized protein [Chelonus insularis]|uniref:uncharacterized protein n=1 Tax=Chelonus insularis TaxID=460826 RepID=UPI00158EB548|nr:uncharacterized protein LOC118074439 [Chelonus insularis]
MGKGLFKRKMIKTNVISLIPENHHFDQNYETNNDLSLTSNELSLTEQDQNYLNERISDDMKTHVMMNHLKYLRELHAAAERCYIKKNAFKCIEIITYCPYLINTRHGIDGKTAFHRVCSHRHVYLMSFMLSKGADPWLKTSSNETALCIIIHASLKNPNESSSTKVCLELLQKYGCYIDFTNDWYQEYLKAAMITNNTTLVKWMFNKAPTYSNLTRCTSLPLTMLKSQ